MSGWIALHRQFEKHPDWLEPRVFSVAEAWIYLLMKANWEDKKDKHGELLKKGMIFTSLSKLASDWKWSKGAVLRQLRAWARETQIEHFADHKRTTIRITKWEQYQTLKKGRVPKAGTQTEREANASGSQHNKEQITNNNKQSFGEEVHPCLQAIVLPQSLSSERFAKALSEWLYHKTERRESYQPRGLKGLVSKLEKLGQERAIAAIEFSIAQNYQGIYEERKQSYGSGARSVAQQAGDLLRAELEAEALRGN